MTAPDAKAPAKDHKPNQKGETPEAIAAFDAYVKLGSKRNLAKLARERSIPIGKVNRWSKKFNWHGRVLALQEEAAQQAKEETKEQFFKDVKNLTEYKYTLLDILKKKVDTSRYCGACEQSPASITEIIRVLEVVKTELGEPTSIAKGTFTEDRGNPFAGIFNSFFGKKDAEARAV
jgi:hypothetical protein